MKRRLRRAQRAREAQRAPHPPQGKRGNSSASLPEGAGSREPEPAQPRGKLRSTHQYLLKQICVPESWTPDPANI